MESKTYVFGRDYYALRMESETIELFYKVDDMKITFSAVV